MFGGIPPRSSSISVRELVCNTPYQVCTEARACAQTCVCDHTLTVCILPPASCSVCGHPCECSTAPLPEQAQAARDEASSAWPFPAFLIHFVAPGCVVLAVRAAGGALCVCKLDDMAIVRVWAYMEAPVARRIQPV
ncbi:unnamed protein product [Pleuronectes platessa]|uniref:Uncharacterized protein n=1 Tax=Pleuronectes platessa TaxID=8262 RepID=A0A9N7TY04_PLEPL|nr:unnamed protein product [Pleuronectes platessa]